MVAVTPGNSYTVVVGAGGQGVLGLGGGAATASKFEGPGNVVLALANGGAGGGVSPNEGGGGGTSDTTTSPLFASSGVAGSPSTTALSNGVPFAVNGFAYGLGGSGKAPSSGPVAGANGNDGAVLLWW